MNVRGYLVFLGYVGLLGTIAAASIRVLSAARLYTLLKDLDPSGAANFGSAIRFGAARRLLDWADGHNGKGGAETRVSALARRLRYSRVTMVVMLVMSAISFAGI
jgi:hypothetical protein